MIIECLNPNYSTTRRLTRVRPAHSIPSDAKFETMLFPQTDQQHIDAGGLRTQGYFKAVASSTAGADFDGRGAAFRHGPLITVITAVLNGAETLEQTILSVIEQSCGNVEYLIIDGGSTDGTLDIIRRYEHAIDYWISEPDGGIYDAWNKAVGIALGDCCIFLGADDRLASADVLKEIFSRYSLSEDYQLICGRLQIMSPAGELLEELGQPWEKISREFEFFHPSLPKFPEVLIHRSLFQGSKTFDVTYRIAGDTKFLLSSLSSGARMLYIDLPVAKMGLGGLSNDPNQLWAISKEVRRICNELGIGVPLKHLAKEWVKLFVKIGLVSLLPGGIYYRCVNFFRLLCGRAPIYNKSRIEAAMPPLVTFPPKTEPLQN